MNLLSKDLLVVLFVLSFAFTAVADVQPPPNAAGQGSVSFGIYDVEKDLTPGGWAVVVIGLALVGYAIFRIVKRPRIK